ncbi:hypothetical protein V2G26_015351 [Clonostachys chloroleuca]
MEIPREEGNGSQRWVLANISLMRSAREVAGPNANACMHADSDKTGDWRTFGGTSPMEKKAKGGLDRHPNGKVNHGALSGLFAAVRASGSSWNSLVHHMNCVTSIVPSARRGRYPCQETVSWMAGNDWVDISGGCNETIPLQSTAPNIKIGTSG